jgi:hypothetical protein
MSMPREREGKRRVERELVPPSIIQERGAAGLLEGVLLLKDFPSCSCSCSCSCSSSWHSLTV